VRIPFGEEPVEQQQASGRTAVLRTVGVGCGVALLLAVLVPSAGWLVWTDRAERAHARALRQQEEKAQVVFEPAMAQLEPSARQDYDLDETVRVIHGLDLALRQHDDLEGYLRTVARQDYRDVAPEVLEARQEILEVLQPLYAKQTELEDQQAMWELTSEMLMATLSVVCPATSTW
jgi:hypothetical protein